MEDKEVYVQNALLDINVWSQLLSGRAEGYGGGPQKVHKRGLAAFFAPRPNFRQTFRRKSGRVAGEPINQVMMKGK